MLANGIQIVFGTVTFLNPPVEEVVEWLNLLEELDIKVVDTAEIYGASEQVLGKAGAASRFTIDTKFPGGASPKISTKDAVIEACKESLKKLGTDAVDVYYIHAPDRRVPWKETLSGLNELYQQGAFKRLGLSNFLAHEVDEAVRVAKENNFVVPTVYQGNYSAVARRTEDEIIPVLRRHNMAFYAYSPIAGGFLSKTRAQLASDEEGRYGEGNPLNKVYNGLYNKPSFVAALDVWEQIAKDEGVSNAELAYRWIVYHSKLDGGFGDAVVLGARKHEQLRQTVEMIKKGPLSDAAVGRIDRIWEDIKGDAWLDNFQMLTAKSGAKQA
ncbi:aflatoxin B1 aldehyde reductase member 3 [Canariomyces notabilis]|uniref:Aflatoxin B1 aldehyde reductase member 3 n=1 Tax=Canariomyces notabilis TaxID=2074819 RepID=A0AAN6YUQ6_9PEZI|nr:aflatoxin B1 aldehyde reductase member 3 [Canariomyces arenarius]